MNEPERRFDSKRFGFINFLLFVVGVPSLNIGFRHVKSVFGSVHFVETHNVCVDVYIDRSLNGISFLSLLFVGSKKKKVNISKSK